MQVDLTQRRRGESVYLETDSGELYQLDVLDPELGYAAVTSQLPTIHDRTRAFVKNSGGQPVIQIGEPVRLEFGNGALLTGAIVAMSVQGRGWNWEVSL